MRSGSSRRPGRPPMVEKQRAFAKMFGQGVSVSGSIGRQGTGGKTEEQSSARAARVSSSP